MHDCVSTNIFLLRIYKNAELTKKNVRCLNDENILKNSS